MMYLFDPLVKSSLILLPALILIGCEKSPMESMPTVESKGIAVANYPLAYFSEVVTGGQIEVFFPVPEGEDPAFWQPDDDSVALFQQAQVILLNGADYSKWVKSVSLPQARLVNTSASFESELIDLENTITHRHGPEGEHSHGGKAFTTWLDFHQAALQLKSVTEAVMPLLPELERNEAQQRSAALVEGLVQLDSRLKDLGEKLRGKALLGSHPVYQYLARRYGLDMLELHWEPDADLKEGQLEELRETLKEHAAAVMIWENEPKKENVQVLSEMGIQSVIFNPCGNRPSEGDFLTVMKSNVDALENWVQGKD